MIYFLDTSAILAGALNKYPDAFISIISIQELERIKTAHDKDEHTKYHAREATRWLSSHDNKQIVAYSNKQMNRILKKYNFLTNINDHYIICSALKCQKQYGEITFITADYSQYLFACMVMSAELYKTEQNTHFTEEFCGWGKYYPDEVTFAMLYSNPKINTLHCKINEFAEVFINNELKDILFWNGTQYTPLMYKEIKNVYTGEVLKPRNLEQKMALHLLQNKDIKIKLLTSAWGSGKTMLALNYALEQVYRGNVQKLIFVRNNIIVADTNDIGFLPGNIQDKMSIWGAPLADHLGGKDALNQLIEDGTIEIAPLSHMRGRSIHSAVVICDECENMTDKLVTLLISRIEEDSELIFCGDVAQIDNQKFEKNNGIRSMIKNLSGNPLFGMVKLIKSERNQVAQLCDLMIPPQGNQ